MQNVVGPTLVAMGTKFGLGMEIQSPTGLFLCFLVHWCFWVNLWPDLSRFCL